jgi:ubiquinone biosynthesis protein COQ4
MQVPTQIASAENPEFQSFELAPPLPARPIQWRRARRLLRELIADPAETDKVFELIDAMGGRGDERTVQRFAAHPDGQQLLVEKPSLLAALADRARMLAHREDSFGRAYLAFAQRNGFAIDGLLTSRDRALGEANAELDPERGWLFSRLNLMHDLWHVLTGYETDPAGEAALLAFSVGQGLANRTVQVLLLAAMVTGPKGDGFAFQRFVLQAFRRGRRAGPLLAQRYENLLSRPLEQVRRDLAIEPLGAAHPDGLFRAELGQRDLIRVPA